MGPSKRLKALQQEKSDLVARMEALLNSADDEHRDLTADEEKDYQELEAQLPALDKRVQREQPRHLRAPAQGARQRDQRRRVPVQPVTGQRRPRHAAGRADLLHRVREDAGGQRGPDPRGLEPAPVGDAGKSQPAARRVGARAVPEPRADVQVRAGKRRPALVAFPCRNEALALNNSEVDEGSRGRSECRVRDGRLGPSHVRRNGRDSSEIVAEQATSGYLRAIRPAMRPGRIPFGRSLTGVLSASVGEHRFGAGITALPERWQHIGPPNDPCQLPQGF